MPARAQDPSAQPGDAYAAARAFLLEIDVRPGFGARAMGRIERQHAELGDGYRRASLKRLVSECAEEAEDLAAWAALVAARLDEGGGASSTARRARALLRAATRSAADADAMLGELRRLVGRAA